MSSIILNNITLQGNQSDIYINDGLISSILPAGTPAQTPLEGAEIIDCSGRTAMPAFVNMHTHAAMSMMRGMKEDVPLDKWLERIWEIEENIDEEYTYWATKVACLEMIKSGTVVYNDQYFHIPSSRRAAAEMGMRPFLCFVNLDFENPQERENRKENCRKMHQLWLDKQDDSTFATCFHAIYTASKELILWTKEYAVQHGLKLHIHLSETEKEVKDCMAAHDGLSPVEYLESLGVLDENVIAAHCLWLSDKDVEILGRRKVNCVHNINSNSKLASGYRFRYDELKAAGANVCIGTDGAASSNNLDMLETVKTSALFQKAWREDPRAWPLDELIDCATVNGAKALGINTGVIEPGKIADILIINTDSTRFLSLGSFLANFIYSAHSDCIESVISKGRFLMRNRKVEGEEEIIRQARKVLSKLA